MDHNYHANAYHDASDAAFEKIQSDNDTVDISESKKGKHLDIMSVTHNVNS